MGSSRHSGGDREDWQEQPRPWEEDPYSPQPPHRPSEPPWDDNSHWSQAPNPGAPPLDPLRRAREPWAGQDYWDRDPGQPPGPEGWPGQQAPRYGQPPPRYGQPPPSWGNDAPSDEAGWGQAPEWADESLGADDSHWAQPSSTVAPPPDGDPYWGQPPPWPGQGQGQPGNWAAAEPEVQSWGTGGTVPGPGDPAAGTTVLPGPGMPGAGMPGAAPQTWPPPPPRRGRRTWVLIVALAGVVALVAGVLLATRHSPGNASAGSNPTTSGTAGGTAGGTGTSTNTPAAKRGPITVANVFPQTQLSIDGLQFTQVAATTVKDCASAANGAFASALTSSGCKRVVRATYVDAHKQYVVTAGVAALPTPADASKVDAVKKFGPDVWFTALNGPASSGASAASKTVGVGNDVVDNRFIVFALSSYSNGQNPTGHPADIQKLTGLSQAFTNQAEQQLVGRVKS